MPTLDSGSLARLSHAHPLLQKLMQAAIVKYPFTILQSQRGRAEQEEAFAKGFSKVHYGNSAHNWSPAIALDLAPLPLSWANTMSNLDRWRVLQIEIIKPIALGMNIPIRQGIDWDGDGDLTDDKWDDLPHLELRPWREFAARDCKPFEG